MNAKDKGFEILKRYINLHEKGEWSTEKIKEMSIISVEEIIKALKTTTGHCTLRPLDFHEVRRDIEYWGKVKEEIEKF